VNLRDMVELFLTKCIATAAKAGKLNDRIVAKEQTQGNSGFVRCSQRTAFGE